MYLLDTNIISHMMVNADGIAAMQAERVIADNPVVQMCTSVVVQAELAFGLAKRPSSRLQKAMNVQLENLLVLPLDEDLVPHYASIRAQLEADGQPMGANDLLIAAQALALDAILVSADTAFERVPGLKLENWLVTATPRPLA